MEKTEIKTKKVEKKSGDRYTEAVGRRKTSIARVRITPASKTTFVVNEKDLHEYFPIKEMQVIAKQPFEEMEAPEKFEVSAKIVGGGAHSQSEALRHGIARALVGYRAELRKDLKKSGYLKRDPRSKERRKFGLKKARKAPQWSKR
jgi:small subunit ribosomal protein S9